MAQGIQIGLIGCGAMGRTLAQAVAATGLGRIRMVFDIDEAKSAAFVQVCPAEVSAAEEALFANPDLQAVILAVPPYLHKESVLKAASLGKHIFLEKPMALDLPACQEMNEAVRRGGLTLMVGHVLRYFEPFRTLTHWTQEGRFGRALHGELWRLEKDYLRLAPWKSRRALSGGYLFEIGAHELDWMRCLFGEPTGVQAAVQKTLPSEHEIEDLVSVQVQFDSGGIGSYLGGAGFPKTEYGFRLRFERATVCSENAFDPLAVKFDWMEGTEPQEISFGGGDPFEAEMHTWLASLLDGGPVPISGEDAEQTIALIEAAYASAGV
jgi:predicted dehydrogenase